MIEDDSATRDALLQLLQIQGHDVLAVATDAEALAQAPAFRPDVLLCDWVLQGATDTARLIRGLTNSDPALRVLIVTGMPVQSLESRLRGLPVERLITKPVSSATLDAILREPPAVEADPGDAATARRR